MFSSEERRYRNCVENVSIPQGIRRCRLICKTPTTGISKVDCGPSAASIADRPPKVCRSRISPSTFSSIIPSDQDQETEFLIKHVSRTHRLFSVENNFFQPFWAVIPQQPGLRLKGEVRKSLVKAIRLANPRRDTMHGVVGTGKSLSFLECVTRVLLCGSLWGQDASMWKFTAHTIILNNNNHFVSRTQKEVHVSHDWQSQTSISIKG